MALKLKIVIGSTRPGRVGPNVAKWVEKAARDHGAFDVELVDLADVGLPLLDEARHPAMQQYEHEHTKRWSKIIADGDAYVFVTPEYDYFPPASLINAIQVLSLEWKYKAAGVVSYGGVSGGLRSAEVLRNLIGNRAMVPLQQVVPVPFFPNFIDDDGNFSANEKMTEGANDMFSELAKWTKAIKPIRDQ